MQTGFIFGILGALLLLIGVFVPLVSVPVYGGINLLQLQQPVAIALLLLAAAHLIFCINKVSWGLYATKIGILAAIGFGIYRGWDRITGNTNFISSLLKPIVKIHWGTGLLAAGILILMAAAVPRAPVPPPKPEAPSQVPEVKEE
ncbi:MAG TPA: hypothetical protein VGL38_05025 [bacterium]|jgi:uncharacterized membrane-anchored protein YitT (DUF2179 family)